MAAHHFDNVTLAVGDAANGWGTTLYDAIVLTASVPIQPNALLKNLKIGGRLFAVIGDDPAMTAYLFTRKADNAFDSVALFETSVEPLRNAPQPERLFLDCLIECFNTSYVFPGIALMKLSKLTLFILAAFTASPVWSAELT